MSDSTFRARAPSQSALAANDRLDSWKEIAEYLRRGARTVQRWEHEEGLPVHRLVHEHGGTVFAYKAELDAWWKRRGELSEPPQGLGPSVAVLPFLDLSPEKDQDYFCEGTAEEIINALSAVKQLRVASRMAAFQYRNESNPREIGKRLHVNTLLEGSVRKSGTRLRITAQLTNAETGYQLWSGRYDREMSDIFAIQDEIAHSIVEALEVTLSAEERGAPRKAPTTCVQAYDYYLRGRSLYYRYGRGQVESAIQLFSQAVALDPGFVLAHAGLADCWSYIYLYAERTDRARDEADGASSRAVELDPESAQAQASRAVALSLCAQPDEAERAFEKAIDLDPNLFEAHYFYARHLFAKGELEKAVRRYERAMEIRPEDYQAPLLVAQSYDVLGRPDEARASRERGVRRGEQHLALCPDDARAVYMVANGLVALGERKRGREWAERALRMEPEEPMLLYNVGCIYSMLGLREAALDCLERGVRHGLTQKGWFDHDSNLDPVRAEPRFQAILRELSK